MVINSLLKPILQDYNIPFGEGILCLIIIYYNLPLSPATEALFDPIMHQINISKIVERDYSSGSIKWNISLYSGENTEWEWINLEYRELFKAVNKERAGSSASCLAKMKEFFKSHPEVRKDDVINAAKAYIKSVDDPQYLQGADYFIVKDKGKSLTSRLEQYLEIVKTTKNIDLSSEIKMMGKVGK